MAALEYHSWLRNRIPSNQLAQLKDSLQKKIREDIISQMVIKDVKKMFF